MTEISFSTSRIDGIAIRQIVDRAVGTFIKNGQQADRMSLHMDIVATHANGCPLRLQALLGADDFNFMHDIVGIERHLDRETGRLGDCFVPRFAQPQRRAA